MPRLTVMPFFIRSHLRLLDMYCVPGSVTGNSYQGTAAPTIVYHKTDKDNM